MAELKYRTSENVPGAFYVDESCIDCDLCRGIAPAFLRRDDLAGVSVVYRQPVTAEEIALAEEALESCPTSSIGSDGAQVA